MKNIRKLIKAYVVILMSLFISNCGNNDDVDIPVNLIKSAKVLDVANSFNSSDIYIELTLEETSTPVEVRILIVKNNEAFEEANLNNLPDESFQSVFPNGNSFVNLQLKENLKDVSGKEIALDTEYKALFAIALSGKVRLTTVTKTFTLTNAHPLEGEYTGRWDDNIYTNFPISTRIDNFDQDQVSGKFYYSANFRSCCGGRDDGFITLTLDGNNIKAFRYDQDLLNYKGGCPGLYTGTGSVVQFTSLEIQFTGNDCDGQHSGGRISMRRIE